MQPAESPRPDGPGRHEPDTFNVPRVIVWFLGLALSVPLTMALVAGLRSVLTHRESPEHAEPMPRFVPEPELVKRGARLNPDLPAELQRLRASERQTLESYGWVNRDRGIARVPIKRAMELLAKDRSLLAPARAPVEARKPIETKP